MKKQKLSFADHLGGDKGSIELSAVFIYFAIFSLCLFINQRISLWNQEAKQRANSITCFKAVMDEHHLIYKRINMSNKVITAANATFIATANPISLQVKKATQIGQNMLLALYFSKILIQKQCILTQKLLLSYVSPILKPIRRDLGGRIQFGKKKINLIFPLTFEPVKKTFLKGVISIERDFIFSNAKEWPLL